MSLKSIIIIIIIVAVVIAGAVYIFAIKGSGVSNVTDSINPDSATPVSQQNSNTQLNSNPDSDKTADISNDLKKVSDDSSLNISMDSLDKLLRDF